MAWSGIPAPRTRRSHRLERARPRRHGRGRCSRPGLGWWSWENPGVRLRLVHGFTQTIRAWETVEARLPRDWDVQPLDIPDGLDFVATAATLGLRGGEGTWVGYSMGGRLCLRLALDRPELVERLVLLSASPGIAAPADREARLAVDEGRVRDLERDGVEKFLEHWLSQRMFETLPREAAMIDERQRRNTVHGLAHQLRGLGQAAHEPMWGRLSELEMPVLVVSGQWDRAYTEIAEQIGAAIGTNAKVVTVEKAGHALHLERPDEVAQLLVSWLETA
ncbi:MAG: alpha/beta fold hydrolase [Acidimicrobiia bacterium]|nr:alpha/beta fold hydrolase [Acidimicrobiia bacterium]